MWPQTGPGSEKRKELYRRLSLSLFKAFPFVPFPLGAPSRQEILLESLQTTSSFFPHIPVLWLERVHSVPTFDLHVNKQSACSRKSPLQLIQQFSSEIPCDCVRLWLLNCTISRYSTWDATLRHKISHNNPTGKECASSHTAFRKTELPRIRATHNSVNAQVPHRHVPAGTNNLLSCSAFLPFLHRHVHFQ